MTASPNIISQIEIFEGFSPTPYWDHKQYSWGYGTKAPGPNGTITKAQARTELIQHLKGVENDVQRYIIDKGVALNQNQFDALLSLVYNLGSGAIFTNTYNNGYSIGSTLYNKILQGKFNEAAQRFTDFVKADGMVLPSLVARRKAEAEIFSKEYTKALSIGILTVGILGVITLYYFHSNTR